MKAFCNQIHSKNINQNTNEKINILYIGDIEEVTLKLGNLDGIQSNVAHYKKTIAAYNDIKKNKTKYDIVFCDSEMIGINAIEFYQLIKKIDLNNTIYIITTQHELSSHYVESAKKLKIDDIIEFPFQKSQLSIRIKYLLSKRIDFQEKAIASNIKTNYIKRGFDVLFSFIAIILLSPIFLIVALLIKFDSNGPIFYTSQRVGIGYRIFKFINFRSIYSETDKMIDSLKNHNNTKETRNALIEECEECKKMGASCSSILIIEGGKICENLYFKNKKNNSLCFIKQLTEPGVTKFSKFLKKSSIDKLPQLFNVFMGDISFVGNRPLYLHEAEKLTTDEWSGIFNAPIGIQLFGK